MTNCHLLDLNAAKVQLFKHSSVQLFIWFIFFFRHSRVDMELTAAFTRSVGLRNTLDERMRRARASHPSELLESCAVLALFGAACARILVCGVAMSMQLFLSSLGPLWTCIFAFKYE